ncbi:MAG: hypothetical protein ACI398_01585 [Clostridium sp.]
MINTNFHKVADINSYSSYYKNGNTCADIKNSSIKKCGDNSINRKDENSFMNLEKYNNCKVKCNKFYSELNDKFSKLKDSSLKVKSYAKNSLFFESDYDEINDRCDKNFMSAAEDFASDYNAAVKFLSDYPPSLGEAENKSQSYKDIKNNLDKLSEVGIEIDTKTGFMLINKNNMDKAIKSDIENVCNVIENIYSDISSQVSNMADAASADSDIVYYSTQLDVTEINNTYFYNPGNSSILQSNAAYSSGIILNYLV